MTPTHLAEIQAALRALNSEFDHVIGGFWVRADPYSDGDEVVALIFDDDDENTPTSSQRVEETVEICDRVASALERWIPATCRFTTREDFEENGPPLDPTGFIPVAPSTTAA